MKQAIFFVWLFLAVGTLHAQVGDSLEVTISPEDAAFFKEQAEQLSTDPSTLPSTREYASGKMEVRKFDPKRWREVVGGHDYNDTRKRKKPPEKQEQQLKKESESSDLEYGPRRRPSNSDDAADYDEDYDGGDSSVGLGFLGPIMQIVFYCMIAAIIVLILYQIARNVSYRANPKKAADKSKSPDEVHDITELDTEGLIRNAHLAGNYKLAIRLYFLHLLKKLNENGVIVWTKDKTNRDYLSELFSKQYYFDEVRKLTLAYERVWYGEHIPTAETYEALSSEFKAIDQKLNATSRP
ncbi:DUF4129 domain-containing protein [Fulvivirgaceae bacterium PWU4]|uniref:DUF4129 domain-containing protein n=1 Tax=Chryseosolibacter histidini TaxID=2782349 RepID=A0AAP2DQY0_9BACT|nr:DUF4129 domain-containing protein [Chryseosolibacter histidini]MBT1698699.1 DUF4129 domain-containing protein [Chryseosolibacter histidini]